MKKVHSINREALRLLTTALLLFVNCIATNAYDFNVDGIYYSITNSSERTCCVTYLKSDDKNKNAYKGTVVIPSTVVYNGTTYVVTSIGKKAFIYCEGMTSVTIPNSVTTIGDYAFEFCHGLTSVTIPNGVTSIGVGAFCCRGLTEVNFNAVACTYAGSGSGSPYEAFSYCNNISTFTFGDNVTIIPDYLCHGLTRLTSVIIPNSVTEIGGRVFYQCTGLTSLTIGNSVETIGGNAFANCSGLTSVIIPNSVTTIANYAFSGCTGLTSLTIGNSVTTIGDYTLQNCSGLTEVSIPNSVTSIGEYAFDGCSGLTEVSIPNSVTSIGSSAFRDCSGLTQVTIGDGVTTIGSSAFRDCSGLTRVTIGNSVATIGDYTFSECSGLTEVSIPNSVTSIGEYAFANSGLESISIPASVMTIGADAFDSCASLSSVVIGESVTSIGDYAFWFCTSLLDVSSLNPEPPSCGTYTFGYVDVNTCVLSVPEGSKESYSTADVWRDFNNIVEADLSPVENIFTNENAVATEYYTLDGKQVPTPQRGLNIIRYSDGTTKKVLVK